MSYEVDAASSLEYGDVDPEFSEGEVEGATTIVFESEVPEFAEADLTN